MIKDIKNVLNLIKMKNNEDVRTNKDWDLSEKYSSIIEELLPKQLENLSNNKDLLTTGSVGKGNYSMVPWVTTFNTNITKSTQKGYYIVYLFHPEGKGVYLSLNQGWSEIKEKTLGVKKAKEKALALSKYLASYLDDNNFEVGRFYYSNNKDSKYDKSDLPSGYAHGSIIYKYYDFETEVYTEDMMISDYKEMIKLLNGLVNKININEYNALLLNINEIVTIIETKELNESINENKNIQMSQIDKPKASTYAKKYKTSTKKQTDDDIEKAHKENKITGQIGEKLAYQYFMNLIEKNISDKNLQEQFINTIDTSMGELHGYGYDMTAFDPQNLDSPVEKYIEIKATKSKKEDEPFYLSLNEIYAMYENPQKYLIFRIIGLNSKTPKFYIIDPYENHDEFESVEDLIEKVFNAECIQFKIFNVKP